MAQLYITPSSIQIVSHTHQAISGGTQDVVQVKFTFSGDDETHIHTVTRNDYGTSVTLVHRIQRYASEICTPPYLLEDSTRNTTINKAAKDSNGYTPCAIAHTAPNGAVTNLNATVKPNLSAVFPGVSGDVNYLRAIFHKKGLTSTV